MKNESKNERITFYLPVEYCEAIRVKAALERRPISTVALEFLMIGGLTATTQTEEAA